MNFFLLVILTVQLPRFLSRLYYYISSFPAYLISSCPTYCISFLPSSLNVFPVLLTEYLSYSVYWISLLPSSLSISTAQYTGFLSSPLLYFLPALLTGFLSCLLPYCISFLPSSLLYFLPALLTGFISCLLPYWISFLPSSLLYFLPALFTGFLSYPPINGYPSCPVFLISSLSILLDILPGLFTGFPSCPVYRISFLPSWLGFFPNLLTGFPQITCRFYCILDPILLRFYCRVFSPNKYPRQSQDGRVKPSKWRPKSIDLSFKIAEITRNLILEYLICLLNVHLSSSYGYGLNTKYTIYK